MVGRTEGQGQLYKTLVNVDGTDLSNCLYSDLDLWLPPFLPVKDSSVKWLRTQTLEPDCLGLDSSSAIYLLGVCVCVCVCVCHTHRGHGSLFFELFMTQFPHLYVGDTTKTNIWSCEDWVKPFGTKLGTQEGVCCYYKHGSWSVLISPQCWIARKTGLEMKSWRALSPQAIRNH